MHEHHRRDDGIVVHNDLSSQLGGVTHDDAIAKHAVVCNMGILHDEVVATHNGLALAGSTTMDSHILTYSVVVANLHNGILAFELQVLRNGTNHRTREEGVAIAQASARKQRHTVHQHVVIAHCHILVDKTERTNLTVLTNLCLGVDKC